LFRVFTFFSSPKKEKRLAGKEGAEMLWSSNTNIIQFTTLVYNITLVYNKEKLLFDVRRARALRLLSFG